MAAPASNKPAPSSALQRVAWLLFFYSFGLFNWFLYLFLALKSGTFFKKPTEQETLRLAISRDQFWNLSKQPIPGFEHAFFKTRHGQRLHYITNRPKTNVNGTRHNGGGNLFIFLHGFPDSSMMWRKCLQEPAIPMNSAKLVCLDLPNYGGSDTFNVPDTSVLEAITEFVVTMREEHEEQAGSDGREYSTIIVGHDWGCVIAFRLAAEASQLADRFVLTNGPHVGLSLANKDRVIMSSTKIFHQFWESPLQNFRSLTQAFNTLRPLLVQVLMFGYIFVFHLPKFMVTLLGSGGNLAFLSGALRSAVGKHREEWNKQEALASTLGPGVIEVDTKSRSAETYGPSVHDRAASIGETFWQQTAYYRHGLATQKWEKSLETTADLYNLESASETSISPVRRRSSASASSALFSEPYEGALRAPATIIWGEKDIAVGKSICLDGLSDYLARGSEIVQLSDTAHWAPFEVEGRAAIAKVISVCAAAGPNLPVTFSKEIDEVYSGTTTVLRR